LIASFQSVIALIQSVDCIISSLKFISSSLKFNLIWPLQSYFARNHWYQKVIISENWMVWRWKHTTDKTLLCNSACSGGFSFKLKSLSNYRKNPSEKS